MRFQSIPAGEQNVPAFCFDAAMQFVRYVTGDGADAGRRLGKIAFKKFFLTGFHIQNGDFKNHVALAGILLMGLNCCKVFRQEGGAGRMTG
jgi:hypothetical protein